MDEDTTNVWTEGQRMDSIDESRGRTDEATGQRVVAAHREQDSIVFALTGYQAVFGLHTTLPRKGSAYSSRANDRRAV